MRHRKANNNLRRKTGHRKSMLANMSCSLIMHKRIKTTLAKAKVLKRFVEPIITKSKNDSTHNRRISFRYLRQKDAVTELFSTVSNKVADRPGGYTRIIKLGNRLGDAAEMCFIELVDFNDTYNVTNVKKKRTRRSKRNESDLKTDTSNSDTNSKSKSNVRNNVKADEAKVEEAKSEEVKSEEVKSEEAKSEEAKSEEAKSEEAKSEEAKSEEAKSDEVKSEELKSEEAKVEEAKSEEDKTQTPIDNTDDKASSEK